MVAAGLGSPAAAIVRVVVAVRDESVRAHIQIRRRDFGLLGGFVRRELDPVLHDGALWGRTVFDGTEPLQSDPKHSLVYSRWHSPQAEQPVVLRGARWKPFDLKNSARDTLRTNAQGAEIVGWWIGNGACTPDFVAGGGHRTDGEGVGVAAHVVPTALA